MPDGLSFVFNIDSNTPGLEDLLGKLDKANVFMERGQRGLKGLDEGTKHASKGAKGLGGAFENLITKGLEPFIQHATRIAEFEFIREGAERLLAFPGELAEKIKELGEDAILTAAKTERMGRAFENALGSDAGKEAFKYFDAIADKTEFSHEQIRGMGLELAKSGFKGEGLKNASAAIADLGSMSGSGIAGAEAATSALQRIITTGRIEARALVPFGIHKEEFLGELGKETGLGMKAVHKALEDGKIPIETTLNSLYTTITNKTGKALGGAGTGMTDTLESRLTHLKEKPDLFYEALKDTDGYRNISDFIGKLGESLNPDSALGSIISDSMTTAIGELGDMLKGVDLKEVFTKVGHLIEELPGDIKSFGATIRDEVIPAVKEMSTWIMPILDAITTTMHGLGMMKDVVKAEVGGGPGTYLAEKATKGLGLSTDTVMNAPGGARDTIAQAGAAVNDSFANWMNKIPGYEFLNRHFGGGISPPKMAGMNDAAGYAGGLKDGTSVATDAMMSFGNDTADALKDSHQQHSPSELFRDIGQLDAMGYALGVRDGADDVAAAMDSTYAEPAASAPAISTTAGGVSLTIEELNITIEGGGDGHEQGRAAARGFEAELVSVLEKVAIRQGSR